MDGFAMEPHLLTSNSTLDKEQMLATSKFSDTNNFAAAMEKVLVLDKPNEEDMGEVSIYISADARKELVSTLNEQEDFDFDGNGRRFQRIDFTGMMGNSINHSYNTKHMIQRHKKRPLENSCLEKKKSDLAKTNDNLLAHVCAVESMLA